MIYPFKRVGMTKLKTIMLLVEENLPKHIKLPFMAESLSSVKDIEDVIHILREECAIWGTDWVGGIAYFGKTEDIEKIKEQTQIYFKKMNSRIAKNQFYLFWKLGDYSLLNLYEDYQAAVDNPYPSEDNVLSVLFGAWCDDEDLMCTLKEKEYIDHWSYGGKRVDLNNSEQYKLLNKMKNSVLSIGQYNLNWLNNFI